MLLPVSIVDYSNPVHPVREYARISMSGKRSPTAIHTTSFLTAPIANRLPGIRGIYLYQDIMFLRPVQIGVTMCVQTEVTDRNYDKRWITPKTTVHNQQGESVVDTQAVAEY